MFGRKSQRFFNGIKAVFSFSGVLVCIFSLYGFSREYRSAVMLRAQHEDVVLHMREFDAGWLTFSVGGLSDLMKKCANILLLNEVVQVSRHLKEELSDSCGIAAKAILVRNPSFARAHAVGLIAAGAAVTPVAYGLAQQAAPFEPWPLRMRLLAAERSLTVEGGALSDDLVPGVSADIAGAMQSFVGQRLLAEIYLRQVGLRPLIQQVAGTRPPEEQRAFLRTTKQMAGENG